MRGEPHIFVEFGVGARIGAIDVGDLGHLLEGHHAAGPLAKYRAAAEFVLVHIRHAFAFIVTRFAGVTDDCGLGAVERFALGPIDSVDHVRLDGATAIGEDRIALGHVER